MSQRTELQNKSLHKFFALLADALNDAGYSVQKTLRADIELPWTGPRVKELLWRPVQIAMTEKKSTTALTKMEPSEIYEVLNFHLGQKLGIHVPWPCEETLAEDRRKHG